MAGVVGSQRIAPGETTEIRVSLDPTGKSGHVAKSVLIHSNDPDTPLLLPVYATVEAGEEAVAVDDLGAVLFSGDCGVCHAERAAGLSGGSLFDAVCGLCHDVGEDGWPASAADEAELREWIARGRRGTGMPGFAAEWGGPLDGAQVESLVSYLSER